MASTERIYLLADMHLRPLDAPNQRARELAVLDNQRLAAFLESIEGRAAGLILVGDAFNFWFERRGKVVGDYRAALSLFKAAADSGLDIHHVSGNRDFAVGEGLGFDAATRYPGFLGLKRGFTVSRLADFGIEPHGPRFRFHQGGKTVVCVHGDALCGRDRMFMLLRWALMGPVGRTLMRFAPWSACECAFSRQQGRTGVRLLYKWTKKGLRPTDLLDDGSVWREMAIGADILVCGHFHHHYDRAMEVAGRRCEMTALPGWVEDGGYGIMENGELRIEYFDPPAGMDSHTQA